MNQFLYIIEVLFRFSFLTIIYYLIRSLVANYYPKLEINCICFGFTETFILYPTLIRILAATISLYFEMKFIIRFLIFYLLPMIIFFILATINSYFQLTNSHVFGFNWDFFYCDSDSSRSLISTIIQSDAAILGLIITLSLFMIQHNSRYSVKTIENFKSWNENPDFWILLIIHLISMTYGTFLLFRIGGNPSDELFNFQSFKFIYPFFYIQTHILFEYFVFFLSILVLVPYTISVLDLINPMKEIEDQISKLNLDSMAIDIKNTVIYNDPYIPIVNSIRQFIIRHDYEIALNGIKKLRCKIIDLCDKKVKFEDDLLIATNFYRSFNSISILAVDKMEYSIIAELILSIEEIGISTSKKRMPNCPHKAVLLLHTIERKAIEKEMENISYSIGISIKKIESASNESNLNKQ